MVFFIYSRRLIIVPSFFVVDTKEASRCFCLYWEGVIPSALVKTRLKYIWSGKPVCSATCLMDIVESSMDMDFSLFKTITQRVSVLNNNPPAMRVETICYTKKSPIRYNIVVQATIVRKDGDFNG